MIRLFGFFAICPTERELLSRHVETHRPCDDKFIAWPATSSNERGSYKCVRILMDSLITTAARALARVAPRQIEAGRPARSLERYADPMAVSQSSGSARELGMRT